MASTRQNVTKQLRQYAGRKLTRRLTRAMPWLGGVVALVTIGAAIRRKGFFGGTVDTALDMIPFVGGAKNLVEAGRGRDFIRDKARFAGEEIRRTTRPGEVPAH
jgi:hypothetical protein